MSIPAPAGPVLPAERIYTLDLIRGCALLGIFVMNMPYFHSSLFAGADGAHAWNDWWDRGAEVARDVLFSGKFNSMFSMLFAVGFTIQLDRFEEREPQRATMLYLRRLAWLFAFGVIHLCVFWGGDVLHIYALLGLLMLGLRRAPEKVLWTLLAACFIYPVVISIVRLATTTPDDVHAAIAIQQAREASNNLAYGRGSFVDALREHVADALFLYSDAETRRYMLGFYVQIFLTMVLGMILGRRRFFQDTEVWLPLVRRLQWWFLGAGLGCGAYFGTYFAVVDDPNVPSVARTLAGITYNLGRVLVMAFYVATLVRAAHHPRWRERLAPLATAGRMPLTNYLMQTLITTPIFFGWGFGLWGKAGPALDLVLAPALFFLVQVPFSRWWLRRYDMGPMEYLWRRLVYGATVRSAGAAPVSPPVKG